MLRPVKPDNITTLILNPSYQPHGWGRARDVMRLLVKGAVKGFDAFGNLAGWEPCKKGGYPLSWRDQTTIPFADSPTIRSAGRQLMSENEDPVVWHIPTIAVIRKQDKFLTNESRVSPNSVSGIYDLYNGVCQFCLESIPRSDATRDHYFPVSMGGANDISNLVLACKKCNGEKGAVHPYTNKFGLEPKVRFPLRNGIKIPKNMTIREEWEEFLYMK